MTGEVLFKVEFWDLFLILGLILVNGGAAGLFLIAHKEESSTWRVAMCYCVLLLLGAPFALCTGAYLMAEKMILGPLARATEVWFVYRILTRPKSESWEFKATEAQYRRMYPTLNPYKKWLLRIVERKYGLRISKSRDN